jgi:hypothetical protein
MQQFMTQQQEQGESDSAKIHDPAEMVGCIQVEVN